MPAAMLIRLRRFFKASAILGLLFLLEIALNGGPAVTLGVAQLRL
jgi:hypothetical protein